MLRTHLYDRISDLYSLSFLEKSGELLVIAPDPSGADYLRTHLPKGTTTITLAKFISTELLKITTNERINKSDLTLVLAHSFHKLYPEAPPALFFQTFDQFTEFRGYTLDIELLSEALADLPMSIAKGIQLFYSLCEKLDLIDEQRSYALLADHYRTLLEREEAPPFKNIIFWGFNFMSSREIDLLKSLAIYFDVYIPFSRRAYNQSIDSDWIAWVSTEKRDEILLSDASSKILKVVWYPKRRLAESLPSSVLAKSTQIILATSEIEFPSIREVATSDSLFECAADIFTEKKNLFFRDLSSFVSHKTDLVKLDKYNTRYKEKRIENQDFLMLKVIYLFESLFKRAAAFGISFNEIDPFFIAVWERVIELDLPRLKMRPVGDDKKNRILSFKDLSYLETKNEETIIIGSESYGPLYGKDVSRPRELLRLLRALGPVRRVEFDFLLLKERLFPIIESGNVTLFLEEELPHKDPAWAEILLKFNLIEERGKSEAKTKETSDPLAFMVSGKLQEINLSATRLESYLSCPRSFYLGSVARIFPFVKLESEISYAMIGSMEHALIRDYFEHESVLDEMTLRKRGVKLLTGTVIKEGLTIDELEESSKLIELCSYARNALSFLYELKRVIGKAKFNFEQKMPDGLGSADLYIVTEEGSEVLIDFKRSGNSIPTPAELLRFHALQLWYYHRRLTKGQTLLFGYFNLSLPKKSLFVNVTEDQKITELLTSFDIDNCEIKGGFSGATEAYKKFESDLITKLKKDEVFSPTPLSASVCVHCFVKNLCPKLGVADDGQ